METSAEIKLIAIHLSYHATPVQRNAKEQLGSAFKRPHFNLNGPNFSIVSLTTSIVSKPGTIHKKEWMTK